VSGKTTRFGRKMTIAVTAVLTSPTLENASQVAGIPVSTLRRWRSRPEFADALLDAQREIFLGACNEVRALALDAARTLGQILRDEKAPPPSRVRACLAVLTLLTKMHGHEVVEARLTRLEAAKRRDDGRRHQ
jgi:hypothetical protein